MKPLYTKKNGTSQRVAAIEVKMPASYPSANVTYGSGSVEDALDGVYDVLKNRDYTLVRGNGVKTYSQLLNELYALVDWTKVNPKTTEFAIRGMYWYKCAYTNSASGVYSFTYTNDTSTSLDIRTVQIKSTGSAVRFTAITSTISRTDMSSQVVENNTALAVYY